MPTNHILLVEDNPDDVTFTRRAFRKNNFDNTIIVARDGVAAVELLLPEEGAEPLRPTIVLLDINLPRMNGLEVLRRLRAEAATRLLPIIMLTTSNDDRDVLASYECGANSFVRKPVSFDDFLHAVKCLGAFWLDVNEPAPGLVAGGLYPGG
jgi:two-component system response regulator